MKRSTVLLICLALVIFLASPVFSDEPCVSSGLLTDNAVVLASGSGRLFCSALIITDGTNAATVTIYDNAVGAAGNVLFKGTVAGASNFGSGPVGGPVRVGYGIYFGISGTGAKSIVYYR